MPKGKTPCNLLQSYGTRHTLTKSRFIILNTTLTIYIVMERYKQSQVKIQIQVIYVDGGKTNITVTNKIICSELVLGYLYMIMWGYSLYR